MPRPGRPALPGKGHGPIGRRPRRAADASPDRRPRRPRRRAGRAPVHTTTDPGHGIKWPYTKVFVRGDTALIQLEQYDAPLKRHFIRADGSGTSRSSPSSEPLERLLRSREACATSLRSSPERRRKKPCRSPPGRTWASCSAAGSRPLFGLVGRRSRPSWAHERRRARRRTHLGAAGSSRSVVPSSCHRAERVPAQDGALPVGRAAAR
jgi:hypothetical protein